MIYFDLSGQKAALLDNVTKLRYDQGKAAAGSAHSFGISQKGALM